MSKDIERADVVKRFLEDGVIQGVFADLRQDAFRTFLRSTGDDGRREAHALANAIELLEVALQRVVDNGERERMDVALAERHPSTR